MPFDRVASRVEMSSLRRRFGVPATAMRGPSRCDLWQRILGHRRTEKIWKYIRVGARGQIGQMDSGSRCIPTNLEISTPLLMVSVPSIRMALSKLAKGLQAILEEAGGWLLGPLCDSLAWTEDRLAAKERWGSRHQLITCLYGCMFTWDTLEIDTTHQATSLVYAFVTWMCVFLFSDTFIMVSIPQILSNIHQNSSTSIDIHQHV